LSCIRFQFFHTDETNDILARGVGPLQTHLSSNRFPWCPSCKTYDQVGLGYSDTSEPLDLLFI
jgi:hypothetical protein